MTLDLTQATVHPSAGRMLNDDGQVSRYKFEGDVTDSWGSNDGTDNTSAGYVSGTVGTQAKDFDGVDDYVGAPIPQLGQYLAKTVTASFWVKTTETSTTFPIATANDGISMAYQIVFNRDDTGSTNSGHLNCFVRDSNGSAFAAGTTQDTGFNDGSWNHVVVRVNAVDGEGGFYVNGSRYNEGINKDDGLSSFSDFQYDVGIGARNVSGTYDSFSDLSFDDLRIYDRALSQAEISYLYNNPDSDVVSPGVSRWSMDDTDVSGSTLTDTWGSNNGTINGPTTGASGVGYTGEAFSFDGVDDSVDMSPPSFSGSVSWGLWVNLDQSFDSNDNSVFGNYGGGDTEEHFYLYSAGSDGDAWTVVIDDGSTGTFVNTGVPSRPGEWVHVFATYDDSTGIINFYENGVLRATDTHSGTTPDYSNNPIFIGERPNGNWSFPFDADEVRIYDRALSQQEVWQLYNIGTHAPWRLLQS